MRTAQKIQQYLLTKSQGVINISDDIANDLVSLVINEYGKSRNAVAKLYQYNWVTDGYELIRTVETDDAYIKDEVIKALEKRPADKSYLWECYNMSGEFEGRIYCINPSLF